MGDEALPGRKQGGRNPGRAQGHGACPARRSEEDAGRAGRVQGRMDVAWPGRFVWEEVHRTPDRLDSAKEDGSVPGEWEADFLDSSGKPLEGFQ